MLVVEVAVVLVLVSTGRLSPSREPPLSFIRHKDSVVDWFRLLSCNYCIFQKPKCNSSSGRAGDRGGKGRKLLWTFYLRRQSRDSLLRFLLLLKIKIKTKQPGALNWIEEERERDFVLLFIWYDRESKERDKHRRNSKRNGRSSRILLITTTATLLLLLYSVYFTRQKRKILVGHAFLLRGTQILQRGGFFFFIQRLWKQKTKMGLCCALVLILSLFSVHGSRPRHRESTNHQKTSRIYTIQYWIVLLLLFRAGC
jgi:hypothetical protein